MNTKEEISRIDNEKLICVMANQVAEARHKLTVQEQRLVLWLIAQNKLNDNDFLTHRLSVKEFELITKTNNGNLYAEVEAITRGLLQKVLEVKNPQRRSRKSFQWFSQVEYLDHQGIIEVKFHDELKPLLLELKKHFTQFRLDIVMRLRSSYSIKFYEMLKSREFSKTFILSLDEIRDWLGIEACELQRYADLRRFVIESAQKELSQKADISFEYIPIKEGRKVVKFKFNILKTLQQDSNAKCVAEVTNFLLSTAEREVEIAKQNHAREKFLNLPLKTREILKQKLRKETLFGMVSIELKDEEIPPVYYMDLLEV